MHNERLMFLMGVCIVTTRLHKLACVHNVLTREHTVAYLQVAEADVHLSLRVPPGLKVQAEVLLLGAGDGEPAALPVGGRAEARAPQRIRQHALVTVTFLSVKCLCHTFSTIRNPANVVRVP